MEVNDRLARIENAINTMWWWLVSTQTGFGTADAGGIANRCLGCDGNPSGGSCAYPDCKLPSPTTEELLSSAGRGPATETDEEDNEAAMQAIRDGLAGREETGGG